MSVAPKMTYHKRFVAALAVLAVLPSPKGMFAGQSKMTRSTVFSFLLFMLSWCAISIDASAVDASAADAPKTNVVLILIDDLGWKDLSCMVSDFYEIFIKI